MSKSLAVSMRFTFAARKARVLRAVGEERKTPADAIVALEKVYDKLTIEFLAAAGTTYGEWLEHGPRVELEEVRAARCDDGVWDRLVDRYAKHMEPSR